jgi:hypothetical protein
MDEKLVEKANRLVTTYNNRPVERRFLSLSMFFIGKLAMQVVFSRIKHFIPSGKKRIPGSRWIPLDPNESRWIPLDPNESRWIPLDPNECF